MKRLSAKHAVLIISFFTTILCVVLAYIAFLNIGKDPWILIAIPAAFLLSYLFVSYVFKKCSLTTIHSATNSISSVLVPEDFHTNTESDDSDEGDIWTKSQFKELERLKDLERYRKEFVGNVSHELKTPIFNIQGYILTLLEGGIDDPNINKLYLQRTEKSIDRMISIVEDLESINKLESGELKLRYDVFDIIKMVEDVFELDQMLANEFKISLHINNTLESPLMVVADKKRMMEVVSNLVLNAIKYGKKKGNVIVSFFDAGDKINVEVKDDGIGVDNKDLPRIFERFFRADKSRSREQGGTGLGLSIVKHIIEGHKQKIKVKSKLGVGTTFTFTIDKAKH